VPPNFPVPRPLILLALSIERDRACLQDGEQTRDDHGQQSHKCSRPEPRLGTAIKIPAPKLLMLSPPPPSLKAITLISVPQVRISAPCQLQYFRESPKMVKMVRGEVILWTGTVTQLEGHSKKENKVRHMVITIEAVYKTRTNNTGRATGRYPVNEVTSNQPPA
jgi:hypothetical protein